MLLAADASLVSRAVEVACDDERADDDGADALAARAARMRRRRARVRALRLLNNVSASEGGARAVLQIGVIFAGALCLGNWNIPEKLNNLAWYLLLASKNVCTLKGLLDTYREWPSPMPTPASV